MKKHLPTLIALFACLMAVLSLIHVADLHEQVRSLRHELDQQDSNLRNEFSSFRMSVNDRLEQQASLLSDFSIEYGELDTAARTVALTVTALPKEHTPGVTEVTLHLNDAALPMTRQEEGYTVTLPIPLFTDSRIHRLELMDNGTLRTEQLDWNLSPRQEKLPQIFASSTGGWTGRIESEEEKFVLELDTVFYVDIFRDEGIPFGIEKVELVEMCQGKERSRTAFDLSETGGTDPANILGDGLYRNDVNFGLPVAKQLDIPFGETAVFYIDVTDDTGIRHRCFADGFAVDENGRSNDAVIDFLRMNWGGGEVMAIYDENGSLLYGVEVDEKDSLLR
ncbi:MAG: hypothetical protein IJC43_07025 [Clostridia bacterium]|nr:hypothetical protein [Clostridia bacterium]